MEWNEKGWLRRSKVRWIDIVNGGAAFPPLSGRLRHEIFRF